MLSSTYAFNDCPLAAVSEVASDSSGEQLVGEEVIDLSLVDSAVVADEVSLELFLLLMLTVDGDCLSEVFADSRCTSELCFLLHFAHDLDVQSLLECPAFKQLTHHLCFCAKFRRSGGVSCWNFRHRYIE